MTEHLLRHAERIYRAIGTLPFDMAVKLIEEGYEVDKLEQQWSASKSEDF